MAIPLFQSNMPVPHASVKDKDRAGKIIAAGCRRIIGDVQAPMRGQRMTVPGCVDSLWFHCGGWNSGDCQRAGASVTAMGKHGRRQSWTGSLAPIRSGRWPGHG